MKNKKLIIKTIIIMNILVVITFLYNEFHGISFCMKINLNGKKEISLKLNEKYNEKGATAKYKKLDLTKSIKKSGKVDTEKVGKYKITYNVKYKMVSKSVSRVVIVKDNEKPVIKLEKSDVKLYLGDEYKEPGVSATDNYDGDISNKIKSTNNINKDVIGEYEVIYTVKDSSGNETTEKRKVTVVEKPKMLDEDGGIAVLNYHFFYDENWEECGDGNCQRVSTFREQLEYLKNNDFKTLTMNEFVDWMYGNIDIPEKSVLITIDDGAMGTGKHNGNKLIPLLEEYEIHATLFLITGWWSIDNYRSEFLDIESHTHDMHSGGVCDYATRGAKMLCSSNEAVLNDLRTSISVTGSDNAFCFPLYAYDDNSINLVKEAGFKTAFIGGGYKVTRDTDKYHVPRYQILRDTSLDTFIDIVN